LNFVRIDKLKQGWGIPTGINSPTEMGVVKISPTIFAGTMGMAG
jgi:hypothetical protein